MGAKPYTDTRSHLAGVVALCGYESLLAGLQIGTEQSMPRVDTS